MNSETVQLALPLTVCFEFSDALFQLRYGRFEVLKCYHMAVEFALGD